MKNSLCVISAILLAAAITSAFADESCGWAQSYKAGYKDKNGVYAGGSEIMHIVAHKGKLYAFNGFWCDENPGTQAAQVLRLDSSDAEWIVDLQTTPKALGYDHIWHMKGNILKSVRFRTDGDGKHVNVNLLVAASWARGTNKKGHHAVSVFTRDDETGKWDHKLLLEGPGNTGRRVPRDIEMYRDPKTGIDRIFMIAGNLGIISGVYNSVRKEIEWDHASEYPGDGKKLRGRPLGIAEANGNLYFSNGGKILVRINGEEPEWTAAFTMSVKGVNIELGGIRGLTAIDNPNGPGESLIFVWTPRGNSAAPIIRLDGEELKKSQETTLRKLYNDNKPYEGTTQRGSLGGYNSFMPVRDPRTGKTAHIVGFEQTINTDNNAIRWHLYYKGALYAIRHSADKYTVGSVNGKWEESKPILIAPRTYARSPFPDEKNMIYFGGHDANFKESTNMAWIFKADMETVLGYK